MKKGKDGYFFLFVVLRLSTQFSRFVVEDYGFVVFMKEF